MMFAARHPERLAVISSVSHVEEELRQKVGTWSETARTAPDRLYDLTAGDNFSPCFREEHPAVIFPMTRSSRSSTAGRSLPLSLAQNSH